MIRLKSLLSLFFFYLLSVGAASAQTTLADSINYAKDNLVISYILNIDSENKNGIAESYNGAIKTIFLTKKNARSRMVSLMRVQSIFFSKEDNINKITVVKESGKEGYKKSLTPAQWQQMNDKYEGATYEFIEDSLQILNYNCKKVIVNLKDGKKITAYFTTALKNNFLGEVEPAFKQIPGLVLQYEYVNKDGRFTYSATNISFTVTGSEVYKIP